MELFTEQRYSLNDLPQVLLSTSAPIYKRFAHYLQHSEVQKVFMLLDVQDYSYEQATLIAEILEDKIATGKYNQSDKNYLAKLLNRDRKFVLNFLRTLLNVIVTTFPKVVQNGYEI